MAYTRHNLDGAVLYFDRDSGVNHLVRGDATRASMRAAPRSLQIGLSAACNMACSFCYRDKEAKSRLTPDYLFPLLKDAAEWGVLEVAFGGGEPLLYPRFPELLHELKQSTPLGLNFTTNGILLDDDMRQRLGDAPSEIRVSAYSDNHYRQTLRRLRGRNVGVNWLVTPANVGLVEMYVHDFLAQGARNVLLLGYMGEDAGLHLSAAEREVLRRALVRLHGLPIRMHICWYPYFHDLPHLFQRPDCGAGDEFLVITPDRCVQACSFSADTIPFESIADLKRIYAELREQKPSAAITGCTRAMFAGLPRDEQADGSFLWQSFSSNNSGDWTIIGKFQTVEEAEKAAEALRRLSRALEAYLASPEAAMSYFPGDPLPAPLEKFGKAHGFKWRRDEGVYWEEQGFGAPVLTAGVVGTSVLVYHEYCLALPERPFKEFFRRVGAEKFGYWQYRQPPVHIEALGHSTDAVSQLNDYFERLLEYEFAFDAPDPPWGRECKDPRVLDDENRSARLRETVAEVDYTDGHLELALCFENAFAGTLAVTAWLTEHGFSGIHAQLDTDMEALEKPTKRTAVKLDLFPRAERRRDRLAQMTTQELVIEAYNTAKFDIALNEALLRQPPKELLQQARANWTASADKRMFALIPACQLVRLLGSDAAELARDLKEFVRNEPAASYLMTDVALAVKSALGADDAYSLAIEWYSGASDRREQAVRLHHVLALEDPRLLDLVESYMARWTPAEPIVPDWGRYVAKSRVDWLRLRDWIELGRPYSLIALDTLCFYSHAGTPKGWQAPDRVEFVSVLQAAARTDTAPRVDSAVKSLLTDAASLAAKD